MDKKQFIKKYGTKWCEHFAYFMQYDKGEKINIFLRDDKLELRSIGTDKFRYLFIIDIITGDLLVSEKYIYDKCGIKNH